MRPWLPLLAVILAGAACSAIKSEESHQKGLGEATADAANDTRILGEVDAAAGPIIRNASDCDAVKAALPEANKKLQEAGDKLKTVAGRATLDALKTQVRTIATNCP